MGSLVDMILNILRHEILSIFANVESIISLALTIWVAINVSRLRRHYTFTARVPELVKRLQRHSSTISNYLNDFEGFLPQILVEVAHAEVVLKSLKKKLDGHPKRSVGQLLKAIRAFERNNNKSDLRDIYLRMIKVADEIKELQEDRKWEK